MEEGEGHRAELLWKYLHDQMEFAGIDSEVGTVAALLPGTSTHHVPLSPPHPVLASILTRPAAASSGKAQSSAESSSSDEPPPAALG